VGALEISTGGKLMMRMRVGDDVVGLSARTSVWPRDDDGDNGYLFWFSLF
jgi:hypothetical protein